MSDSSAYKHREISRICLDGVPEVLSGRVVASPEITWKIYLTVNQAVGWLVGVNIILFTVRFTVRSQLDFLIVFTAEPTMRAT